MSGSPQKPREDIDFSKIERAPLEPEPEVISTELFEALAENSRLRYELEKKDGEVQRLSGRVDIAEEKAKLIRPFSWWVYKFAVAYCAAIFGLIGVDAFHEGAQIDPTVLSIMAGSTAVSVVGLVSVILTGLYRNE